MICNGCGEDRSDVGKCGDHGLCGDCGLELMFRGMGVVMIEKPAGEPITDENSKITILQENRNEENYDHTVIIDFVDVRLHERVRQRRSNLRHLQEVWRGQCVMP